ncbi:hypothetical protein PPYR_04391 [Photinus pyralis]|uniref:Ionotropic glutamate receptor C-terminal domain-containing protein n=1 Tax=Photinus pyralis TaxID=7054 RepID=A0A5N4AXV9_PHOPY|nr:hypothetical protein PPYR_04391 [Photinus pyralis]
MIYAKREILKHGGLNVIYYSLRDINVKRDITAMLTLVSCEDTWKLFNLAREENLLHMAISEPDCPRLPLGEAIVTPMLKNGEELPQLVLDLRTVNAYRWKSVIILYDYTLERDMVTRVISSFTRESSDIQITGAAVSIIELASYAKSSDNKNNIRKKLSVINIDSVGTNFLAIVSIDTVQMVMNASKTLGLTTAKNQWLFVISDTDWKNNDISYVTDWLREGDNIAFVYNTTMSHPSCVGGLQCHVEELLQMFTKSLENAILQETESAIQVSDEEWEAIRPTKLERRLFLLQNVQKLILDEGICDNCTRWRIEAGETWGKEYEKRVLRAEDKLIKVGTWRLSDGPSLDDQLFPHVAHGFRRKNLPMISYHNPPWQILKLNENGTVTEFGGLVFDIIKELSRNLNFTYTVHATEAESSETLVKDKDFLHREKYNVLEMTDLVTANIPPEILKKVTSKEVALGAGGFTITAASERLVNFTYPISIQTYTFLASRPRKLSRALLFMYPFTPTTWLCLAASVMIMGPILYFIHNASPVYDYKGIPRGKGLSSPQNCLWYMYGALLQQGGMHLPYADSARLIVGTWWLVVLVVATTYCGNLVAFLTFPKIDIPITTESPLPKLRELYRGMMKDQIDYDKMFYEVEQGRHVYFDWKTKLIYFMKKQYLVTDRCDLTLGREDLFDEKIAMVMAPDTPYLTLINDEIKRLHQVGLIDKWYQNYLPKKDKCFQVTRVTEVTNHTVNLDDMQGSFFVLLLGFTLASLWLLGEVLYTTYKAKKKEQLHPFVS